MGFLYAPPDLKEIYKAQVRWLRPQSCKDPTGDSVMLTINALAHVVHPKIMHIFTFCCLVPDHISYIDPSTGEATVI